MSATAAAPSAAAAPAPPAETPSDGGGRGGGVRRARRPRATSGKIWTASETVCAFYAGSRASLFKQQNELANLCELTNNAYQEGIRYMGHAPPLGKSRRSDSEELERFSTLLLTH